MEEKTIAVDTGSVVARRRSPWRIAGWTAAALLLLVPLVAMQFTDEVNWSATDFVFAGVLIGGVGACFELAVRKSGDTAYRIAVGVALASAFLLIWINGAVGIIGSENNDANLMYAGVLAIGLIGALIARFRPLGMARVLFAAAIAQVVVAAIAIIFDLDDDGWNTSLELAILNGFFVVLFVGLAGLFLRAAQGRPRQGTA